MELFKILSPEDFKEADSEAAKDLTRTPNVYVSSNGRFTFDKEAQEVLDIVKNTRLLFTYGRELGLHVMNVTKVSDREGFVLTGEFGRHKIPYFTSKGLAKYILDLFVDKDVKENESNYTAVFPISLEVDPEFKGTAHLSGGWHKIDTSNGYVKTRKPYQKGQ